MHLIGPDGKFVQVGVRALPDDAAIEKMVADLAPRKVGREVAKEVDKAAKAFDAAQYGTAHKEAQKIVDAAAADASKYAEKAVEDAKFVLSLVEKQVGATTNAITRMESEKDYLTMQNSMAEWKKQFKGHAFEETLKEKEKVLKTKEAKKEIKAMEGFIKLRESWNKADAKGKEGMKASVEKFIKDNDETKAAEHARKMIGS